MMEYTFYLKCYTYGGLYDSPIDNFTIQGTVFKLYRYNNPTRYCLENVPLDGKKMPQHIQWIIGDPSGIKKRQVIGDGQQCTINGDHTKFILNNTLAITVRMRDPAYFVSGLFNDPQLADLHVNVRDQVLSLHKCIVCPASPVIKSMVEAAVASTSATAPNSPTAVNSSVCNIAIDDEFSLDAVKYSFAYVYDELKSAGLPQNIDMGEVCGFAVKYEMRALEAHCIDKLKRSLSVANCWEVYQVAKDKDYVSLGLKSEEMLKKNGVAVFKANKRQVGQDRAKCLELAYILFDKTTSK